MSITTTGHYAGLGLPQFSYTKGLHELGNGSFAWLQPDGGWGWSNAGLITDSGESLLIDTLYDMTLTADMLAVMRDAAPAAKSIGTIINTHANGDHCNGNGCCPQADIIASKTAAAEQEEESPAMMAALLEQADDMGALGAYFKQAFGAFDFAGVERRLPTRLFEDKLTISVGTRPLDLIEVGPAHTGGDVLVHDKTAKTVYSGDILFIEGTPICWAGPISNCIAACETILSLEPELIVPGHGPITDRRGVQAVIGYLTYIRDEARILWDQGVRDVLTAAQEIALGDFDSWGDAERIAINVSTLFRDFEAEATGTRPDRPNPAELFGLMATIHNARAS